mmetsp:Transcript_41002/g.66013  ORF Transcript_41002/g.66013 Transcript_41002/m.66013 type:complete len:202 (+) Transcript_41002:493-1098(+)
MMRECDDLGVGPHIVADTACHIQVWIEFGILVGVEGCYGNRATNGVCRIGMPVKEPIRFLLSPKRLEDIFGGEGDGKRQGAARQELGVACHVGLYPCEMARALTPEPPQASKNLVHDDRHLARLGCLGQLVLEERVNQVHSACAMHDSLHHHSSNMCAIAALSNNFIPLLIDSSSINVGQRRVQACIYVGGSYPVVKLEEL